ERVIATAGDDVDAVADRVPVGLDAHRVCDLAGREAVVEARVLTDRERCFHAMEPRFRAVTENSCAVRRYVNDVAHDILGSRVSSAPVANGARSDLVLWLAHARLRWLPARFPPPDSA